jgi:hypothetical protein
MVGRVDAAKKMIKQDGGRINKDACSPKRSAQRSGRSQKRRSDNEHRCVESTSTRYLGRISCSTGGSYPVKDCRESR